MTQLNLVATAAFGLEAIVVRELQSLGYTTKITRPGRIEFTGTLYDVCKTNVWLRCADRVLIQLAKFPSQDFDALFDQTLDIPWENWIAQDAAIPVKGRSRKSQLTSVPACQRTVKKAIVQRLQSKLRSPRLPESGPPVPVEIAILEDEAIISIDTTGHGLHRRGYRKLTGAAQIRETLASALVQLSFWKPGRPLLDPFCGTGTIPIEAAMLGRNMAPGLHREFAAEHWPCFDAEETKNAKLWQQVREEAKAAILPPLTERIIATDADAEVLELARYHAEQAGVAEDIHFQQRIFSDTLSKRPYGCLIANPPYGERLGEDVEVDELYRDMPEILRRLKTWSHFILTAREGFEQLVGQKANRRRKLYNGGIECTYYQYHGPRPGSKPQEVEEAAVTVTEVAAPSPSPSPVKDGGGGQVEKPLVTPAQVSKAPQAFGGLLGEARRQSEEFANRLRKRARHLRRWPTKRGITCFRIYDRDIPEIPLVVDRYEDALHIAEYERPHERTAAQHADWLDAMVKTAADTLEIAPENVFVKFRERKRGTSQYERFSNATAVRVVTEAGLKFQVNLSDYLDTGLFLDHRITRQMVREEADGKRFLNLFAYTGAFTVYAAAGGAATTTTVDLSTNYVRWAQDNMRLNGFEESNQHQFICSDVSTFLEDLPSKKTYDLAIVDPPTFSNSKGLETDWDIQQNHAQLLRNVLAHISFGGVVYFSTNFRRFKLDESAITQANATVREISRQTVPEDYRNKRIHRTWRLVKE